MRSVGNCGQGDQRAQHEPRDVEPNMHPDKDGREIIEFGEVAWHNGKNASATGSRAVARRKAKAATARPPMSSFSPSVGGADVSGGQG